MDPELAIKKLAASDLMRMPYSNCHTQIVGLKLLDLPQTASEEEYRSIYQKFIRSTSPTARLLESAVLSITTGIAPPVAFPTETVYGLGADATNAASITGIFAAKGRPSDNPLIVHVASKTHLERMTGQALPAVYNSLVEEYWPGPLTVLIPLPEDSSFAPNVHPGQKTVGIRVPESKYARFFIAATDRPIAGPSANSSGKPSPTTARHVLDDMKGKINFILDGGSCTVGVESTVVDGLCDPPLILRPGGVSREDLIAHGKKHGNAWERVQIGYTEHKPSRPVNGTGDHENQHEDVAETAAPRAPGMKYKHYAPKGRMMLFEGANADVAGLVQTIRAVLSTVEHDSFSSAGSSRDDPILNIAILTTTNWSRRENSAIISSQLMSHHDRAVQSTTSTPIPLTPTTQTTTITTSTHQTLRVRISTIHLGTTAHSIAQNLFAVLRLCDDLECAFIFAEAPERAINGALEGRHYEAVMERTRKAASEIVER